MGKKKSLGLNAVLNGIRTMLNLLFPLITFPYVSRVLDVDNVGKFNFAMSVNTFLLLAAALGITTYAVREGTKIRDNREEFSKFASKIFSINFFSTVITYIIAVILVFAVPKFHDNMVLILVFSIEIFFTTIGTEWIFTIYEEYAYITVRSIVFKIISVVALFLFVKHPDDHIVYAGITVFANAGSNIMNFFRTKKYCDLRITFRCDLKTHLKPIMVIFASLAAVQIYINSDNIMLGFMATDYEVGIYGVSTKVYRIVKQMLSAVLVVSIPRLAMLMGNKRMDEYRKTLTQIFNVLVVIVLPTVVGLFMMSKEVVLLISTEEYVQATSSLRLLSIALFFCIFGWIYNQCVLIPAKKEKIVLIATIISALANVLINFALIPVWKENAVAFSTIVAEAIMMLVCVYYGRKEVRLEPTVIRNIVQVSIGCAAVAGCCILVKLLNLGTILTLFAAVASSGIAYFAVIILTKNTVLFEFLKSRKKKPQ